MMIREKIQIFHQFLSTDARKSLCGTLRLAVLLCALALLPVAKAHAVVEKAAIYEGETLLWRCMQVSENGAYNDYESGTYYTLHLRTIDTTRVIEPDAVLCDGDTLLWRCRQVVNAGVYVDTVTSLEYPDLDSVYYQVKVVKTIPDTIPNEANVQIGETLLWRCMQILATKEGTFHYYDVEPGVPCDIYYHLTMKVGCPEPDVVDEGTITICKGDTLLWHCLQLDKPNTGDPYEYEEPNPLFPNCVGTIYKLNLKVNEPETVENVAEVLVGETLLWRCMEIPATKEGKFDYYDVEPGVPCDINYHLTMKVGCPEPDVVDEGTITICKGDTLLWHCLQLDKPNAGDPYEYEEPNPLFPNCPGTIYKLNLEVNESDTVENEANVFIGETLLWRCKQIFAAAEGTFEYDDVEPGVPCDTYYHLTMKVGCPEPEEVNDTLVYCGHDTVLWRCEKLAKGGDYEDVIKSKIAPQCDSIIYSLHLIYHKDTVAPWDTIYVHKEDFNPYYYLNDGAVKCETPDEYAFWEPFAKTAYEQAHGLDACDSIMHRVRLIQRDTVEGYTCNGDTMLWRCQQAFETKVYFEPVVGVGQISGEEYTKELHYLDFTFVEAPKDSVLDLIVTDDHYEWRSQYLTENGTYHDTTYVVPEDKSSCIDSLFTLNLKLEPVKEIERSDTICAGDTLLWRCQQVFKTDEYADTLRYPSGNDSIRYTLHLTVHKDSVAPWDTIYVHQDELPYTWKGLVCENPGEYELYEYYEPLAYQQALGEHGCDSIYSRVRIIVRDTVEQTSCNGEKVTWRGIIADHTAVYGDTVKAVGAVSGEETIIEQHYLDFHFFDAPKDSVLTDTISGEKLPYIWRHTTEDGVRQPIELTETGIYHDTTYYENNYGGCIDSLFTLNLRVENVIEIVNYDTICAGDTLLWRCQQVYKTDEYADTLRYPSGNDSIRYTLHLTVHKDSVAPWDTIYVHQDELPYTWKGLVCENPGEYELYEYYEPLAYQQALGEHGCDSIYSRVRIIVRDTVEQTSCNGEKVTWRGIIADHTAVYGDTVKAVGAVSGEETIIEQHYLDFHFFDAPKDSVLTDTISGEKLPYIWRYTTEEGVRQPIELTETGIYHDTTYYENNYGGCIDSLFTLNLRVENVIEIVNYDTICAGDTLLWRCQQVYKTDEYADTLRYPSGNDSIRYTLHLTVHKDSVAPWDTIYVHQDELPYTWKGLVCENPGEYELYEYYEPLAYQQALGEHGCDSIYSRVRIIVRDTVEQTSCNGEKVTWRGIIADHTAVYGDTVKAVGAVSGEETIIEQHYLDFHFFDAPKDSVLTDTISGEKLPYIWRYTTEEGVRQPIELTETGIYHDTTYYENNYGGCIDSLFTLNLRVENVIEIVNYDTICAGDTLLWRCQQVFKTDEYADTLRYPSGNDSIRYTLHLTVHKDSVAPWDTIYVHQDELPYTWKGLVCENPGEYELYEYYEPLAYQQALGEHGCDSIYSRVRIIVRDTVEQTSCNGEKVTWRGIIADHTAVYGDTVKAVGAVSGEETIIEQHYLDFHFFDAPKDSVLTDTISGEKLPYIWRHTTEDGVRQPIELTETGIYHDTTYYENNYGGCIDSLFTLNLRVENVIEIENYDTICRGEVELWRCFQADTTGWYRDTLRYEESGNDSVRFALWLEVRKDSIAPIDTVIICNNDPLPDLTEWEKVDGDGYNYERQTYYQRTVGQMEYNHGCDSILFRMMLIERRPLELVTFDTICVATMTDTVHYTWTSWHDTTVVIAESIVAEDSLVYRDTKSYSDSLACDSVHYTHKVVVRRLREMTPTRDTICGDIPTEGYAWKLPESDGEVLHINDFTPEERSKTGQYTVTREYTKYFRPTSWQTVGCDSAHFTLTLDVFKPTNTYEKPTVEDTIVCYSDVFHWEKFDTDYEVAGVYDTVLYYPGTECIKEYYRLNLQHYNLPDTISDAVIHCENAEPFLWRGQTITTAGVYWDSTFYEGTQCVNHYFRYEVDMLPTVRDTVYNTFCDRVPFPWGGRELTEEGWYYDTVPYQVLGSCDSLIHTLYLTELVPEEIADTAYICNGETYSWRDKSYDKPGTYRETILSHHGCDSLYYILVLEKQAPMEKYEETLYICNDGSVFWPFNGKTYDYEGRYRDTLRSQQGCDSIAGELHVLRLETTYVNEDTAIYETETYTWRDGNVYTETGTYQYAEKFAELDCDSVVYTLNLKVLDIEPKYSDVIKATVCAGDSVAGRKVTDHSQWSDTIRTIDDKGARVDSIYIYDIDVYDTSLPEGFMKFVVASCGLSVNVDSAMHLLEQHIDNSPSYAPNDNITWLYSTDGGTTWQPVDGETSLEGNVDDILVRCVLQTDCDSIAKEERYAVGKHSTPETYTEYDQLPVVILYNGTMFMVDVSAVCEKFGWQNGDQIKPEDVQWFRIVGNMDNLTYPDPNDPKDTPMNKWGYYYTPDDEDTYYALIKGRLEVSGDDCGVWARTIEASGTSPVQLQPNVSEPNGTITITQVSECYVSITDMVGSSVMSRTKSSGTFHAPNASGTYFVTIETGVSMFRRTLIVY